MAIKNYDEVLPHVAAEDKKGKKQRLVIVSNRLPVRISKENGKMDVEKSIGGLATGLGSFYKSFNSVWVGWPGITTDDLEKEDKEELTKRLAEERCYPVNLSDEDIEQYYNGFSNKTIWPLFHYFATYSEYSRDYWHAYRDVNQKFFEQLKKVIKPDDIIWIHDYHLMLLPKLIRDRFPDARVGFFLHIPFPSYEIFRTLTLRKELLEGILGSDLVGFHTYDYAQHFLDSVHGVLGYEHSMNELIVGNRLIKADVFPMGIDYHGIEKAVTDPEVGEAEKKMRKRVGDRKIILSIDRMDYSKGIPNRLKAYDIFLEKYPEWREKVTLIMLATPSRKDIDRYQDLKKEVDELVGRINGTYGKIEWTPVLYIHYYVPFAELMALYKLADVGLITPMRDGMNLVAKEFLAAKTDNKGVLVLSEMAGAAKELGEAVIVNPNNIERMAEKIKFAMEMSERGQIKGNVVMRNRLRRYDVIRWANDFVERLADVKKIQKDRYAHMITSRTVKMIQEYYKKARKRLLLVDYDGTLVPFYEWPENAKPDPDILSLMESLVNIPGNDVVIISGREKETLEKWFEGIPVGLVAEHGAWIREKDDKWVMNHQLNNDWKDKIRPVLNMHTDRTPGSFVEEKEFSLAWHYRNANPSLGSIRVKELKSALLNIATNLNLCILEGNKVVEIKNADINKGQAAAKWIKKKEWDFIFAIGDDSTDEDTFKALPEDSVSVKVGIEPSHATFNVDSVWDARLLLKSLMK